MSSAMPTRSKNLQFFWLRAPKTCRSTSAAIDAFFTRTRSAEREKLKKEYASICMLFFNNSRLKRPLGHKIKPQAGIRPIHHGELTRAGKGEVGRLHVAPAKADIGRVDV